MKQPEWVRCPYFHDRCYSEDCTAHICQSLRVEENKRDKQDRLQKELKR